MEASVHDVLMISTKEQKHEKFFQSEMYKNFESLWKFTNGYNIHDIKALPFQLFAVDLKYLKLDLVHLCPDQMSRRASKGPPKLYTFWPDICSRQPLNL